MSKSSLKFLIIGVVAAVLLSACFAALDPGIGEDPVEYDEQGRRLITVSVPADGAGLTKAVNAAVAKANINFYEVVFYGPGTGTGAKYYSASIQKAAGELLTIRVPEGAYKTALFAGKRLTGKNAVLLAFAENSSVNVGSAAASITYVLKALSIDAKTNIVLTETTPGTSVVPPQNLPASSYPYWKLATGSKLKTEVTIKDTSTSPIIAPVAAAGTLAATTVVSAPVTIVGDDTSYAAPALVIATPAYDAASGVFSFNITAGTVTGVSSLSFDVPVKANLDTTLINNTADAITWHLRAGLINSILDNGAAKTVATNTGGGVLIVVGETPISLTTMTFPFPTSP